MKYEYLIFNAVILSGPLMLSFDKRVHFVSNWRFVFPAIALSMVPFIIWDSLVTGKHWWFNEQFTLDFRLAGLPIGEWLFFISVPYASIFIWECLNEYFPNRSLKISFFLKVVTGLALAAGIVLLLLGKQYTGITLIVFSAVNLTDIIFKDGVFSSRNLVGMLGISTILMFVFNGYLTARPILIYGEAYQLGLRLWTIPIEDFIYGYSLLMLNVLIYEKLKSTKNG